jgi:NADPH:quinone reductase-like Zn-dependent oxidoreductase
VRAYAVERFGQGPAVVDLPRPVAGDGYLVRVTYAGVNPVDYKLVDRLTSESSYPFVLGVDFAGVLEEAPPDEPELHTGDRVFGMARTRGSYAEYTTVPLNGKAEALARIPDAIADYEAAALPVSGIAALGAIDFCKVAAGRSFVVMGATGGVGGYAMQLAKSRGAHVIATVYRDADEAVRLGAEEVYDITEVDVIDAIKQKHPDGVDSVLDVVNGADTIKRDADILHWGGRLVSTLYAADLGWFGQRRIAAHNIASVKNRFASRPGLNDLGRFLEEGAISARITITEPLENAEALLDQLRQGAVRGKAVIRT